jgi:hypothetical protein
VSVMGVVELDDRSVLDAKMLKTGDAAAVTTQ